MTRYQVTRKDVYETYVVVEADDPDEAICKVQEGLGDEMDYEYSHPLSTDLWGVEAAPNP